MIVSAIDDATPTQNQLRLLSKRDASNDLANLEHTSTQKHFEFGNVAGNHVIVLNKIDPNKADEKKGKQSKSKSTPEAKVKAIVTALGKSLKKTTQT